VTGAGGFIGSHLTERLVRLGAHARAFIRYSSTGSSGWLDHSAHKDGIEVIFGDIRDRETLRRAVQGVDVVFHLASLIGIPYSYHAPLSYVRTNVEGTANVLQSALDANVKLVVHTSTSEVYGTARYMPIDEDHPLQGQSPYSACKIAADKLAEAYHAVGIRCDKPADLDGAIREMIEVPKPVIFDCVVDPAENCFPMIPSGRAHNEMLLNDAVENIEDAVTEEGKVMV